MLRSKSTLLAILFLCAFAAGNAQGQNAKAVAERNWLETGIVIIPSKTSGGPPDGQSNAAAKMRLKSVRWLNDVCGTASPPESGPAPLANLIQHGATAESLANQCLEWTWEVTRNGQPATITNLDPRQRIPIKAINGAPVGRRMMLADCPILSLDLGPLHLDLLGLVVDLDEVHLDIVAESGPGNLLGNLLCAVVNLLNGGGLDLGALGTAINNVLVAIGNLLGALNLG